MTLLISTPKPMDHEYEPSNIFINGMFIENNHVHYGFVHISFVELLMYMKFKFLGH